jgi:hypothetical protein
MLSESEHQSLGFKDRRGPDFRIHGSRYYSTYLREVERVGLGYGTRLSGYTTLGRDTTQQLNSGLKHSIGIKDHVGLRVSGRQETKLNCINLKSRRRINFSLISWYK